MARTTGTKTRPADTLHSAVAGILAAACTDGEPTQFIEVALKEVKRVVAYDGGTIFARRPTTGHLAPVASAGKKVDALDFLSIEGSSGLSAWVADSHQPVLLKDRTGNRAYDPETTFASLLSVPIIANDAVIGAINLGSNQPGGFDEQTVAAVESLAAAVAPGIELLHWRRQFADCRKALVETRNQAQNSDSPAADLAQLDMLTEEAGAVNHRINNALTIILGNIQCLAVERAAVNQRVQTRLKRIEQAALEIRDENQRLRDVAETTTRINRKHNGVTA